MSAFLYGIFVQWKIDARNKDAFLLYYGAPLLVYILMSGVFSTIMVGMQTNLIMTMSIFTISMGALLGAGASLNETYGSDIRKAYQVGGIPLIVPFFQNLLSAFIHISLMSCLLVGTAPILFGAQLPENMGIFIICILLYILLCVLISSALGLWLLNSNKMMMVAQCIFMPSILLSGIMMPVDMLNDTLQMVSKLLPANWAFVQMNSTTILSGTMIAFVGGCLFFLGFCLFRLKSLEKVK